MKAACFILGGDGILSIDDNSQMVAAIWGIRLNYCALYSSGFPPECGSLLDVGITFDDCVALDYGIPL